MTSCTKRETLPIEALTLYLYDIFVPMTQVYLQNFSDTALTGPVFENPGTQSADSIDARPQKKQPTFQTKTTDTREPLQELRPKPHPLFQSRAYAPSEDTILLAAHELARQLGSESVEQNLGAFEQLTSWSEKEWRILKNDRQIIMLLRDQLSHAMRASPEILDAVTREIVKVSSNPVAPLLALIAMGFIKAFAIEPDFLKLFENELFEALGQINQTKDTEESAPMILTILDALDLVPEFSHQAYQWCQNYLEKNGEVSRSVLMDLYLHMIHWDPEAATTFLLQEVFTPLDATFNPRADKKRVHGSYYRHVGAAESLSRLVGQRSVALQHRINQENNEWGRILEDSLRNNEILLMDFLGPENAGNRDFDPTGILRQNASMVHVLRVLHHKLQDAWFDPVKNRSEKSMTDFFARFSFETYLNTRIPPTLYEKNGKDFDNWLLELGQKNPVFLDRLRDLVALWPLEDLNLPLDVFFMEINETEFYQYLIRPAEAMPEFAIFIGQLRSWTSGYHGRYLTRMMAFQDQGSTKLLDQKGISPDPKSYYSRYSHLMSERRFEDSILPIIRAGLDEKQNRGVSLTASEALAMMESFETNLFHHYLPSWLLFVIDHRFFDETGQEDFAPMKMAFQLLANSPFPQHHITEIFKERGYIPSPSSVRNFSENNPSTRETLRARLALDCLKKLPSIKPQPPKHHQHDGKGEWNGKIPKSPLMKNTLTDRQFERISTRFDSFVPAPGSYQSYRHQAKKLIGSGRPEAIQLILDRAFSQTQVNFPKNAPLSPLIPGPIGQIITQRMLNRAFSNMATVAGKRKGTVLFSNILIRWARQNGINLSQVFAEALREYKTPDQLAGIQADIFTVEQEIRDLQALLPDAEDSQQEELYQKITRLEDKRKTLEKKREETLTLLKSDPKQMTDQALFQIINSTYNAILKQYLKKILMTGDENTAEMVETYLIETLLPQKEQQMAALMITDGRDLHHLKKALEDTQSQIDFLFDVLNAMENQSFSGK